MKPRVCFQAAPRPLWVTSVIPRHSGKCSLSCSVREGTVPMTFALKGPSLPSWIFPRGFWRVEETLWLTGLSFWDPSSVPVFYPYDPTKKKKNRKSLVWLWKNEGFSYKCCIVYMVNKTLPPVDFLWGGNWWSQLSFLELPLQLNLGRGRKKKHTSQND